MKIRNFINAAGHALLVFGFLFLPVSSVHAASNDKHQTFTFLPKLEGLRFDTPISPLTTIDFLTHLDVSAGKQEKTLIIRTKQEPHASLLDLLVPEVEAVVDESTQSAWVSGEEPTISADIEQKVIEDKELSVKLVAATSAPLSTPKSTPTTSSSTLAPTYPSTTAKPTVLPTPVPTTSPTPEPTVAPANQGGLSTPGGLNADKIFDLVNNYRTSKGLNVLVKDERVCETVRSRAPEVGAEISGGYMHKGMRERNLPYWNSENIISMRTEEAAVNWWINDYIHRVQMEGDYTYSCVACHGNSCVQHFTNFQSKR